MNTYHEYRDRVSVLARIHRLDTLAPGEKDLMHRLELEAMRMVSQNTDITCRYYETPTGWRLDCMDGGRRAPLQGEPGEQPEWLQVILDVARIGGHAATWPGANKEPTITVWFRIDRNNQLTEFIEWLQR